MEFGSERAAGSERLKSRRQGDMEGGPSNLHINFLPTSVTPELSLLRGNSKEHSGKKEL